MYDEGVGRKQASPPAGMQLPFSFRRIDATVVIVWHGVVGLETSNNHNIDFFGWGDKEMDGWTGSRDCDSDFSLCFPKPKEILARFRVVVGSH